MRTRMTVLSVLLVLAAWVPASGADSTTSGGSDPGTGSIDAGVHYYFGRWSGRHSTCRFQVFQGDTVLDKLQLTTRVVKTVAGVVYQLYTRRCPGIPEDLVWIGPGNPRRLVGDARDQLASRLPQPVGGFAPPPDRTYVTVDNWFWTTTDWAPVSITAWVPTEGDGTVWATTTATPDHLEFDPGDGSGAIQCDGPGAPWTTELGEDAVSPCSFRFRHTSLLAPDGRAFTGRLSIAWTVEWTSSTGEGGLLAAITTESTARFVVGEIQAVVSG